MHRWTYFRLTRFVGQNSETISKNIRRLSENICSVTVDSAFEFLFQSPRISRNKRVAVNVVDYIERITQTPLSTYCRETSDVGTSKAWREVRRKRKKKARKRFLEKKSQLSRKSY